MEPKILTPQQGQFLKCVAQNKSFNSLFYLTGGTALAAFYLHHRYSEDLDFFSEKEVDLLQITAFVRSLKKQLKYKKTEFQKSLNRNLFFLTFPDGGELKVEFTWFPGVPIEPGKRMQGLKIDSLLDIAVNKAFTIAQNARTRDFIDLYLIFKKNPWDFQDLLKKARAKFDVYIDPIQIGAQLMKVTAFRDYPRMIVKLNDSDWQNFFIAEAKKLKPKIFRK